MNKPRILTQLDVDNIAQGRRYVFYGALRKEKSDEYKELYHYAENMIGQYRSQFGHFNSHMGAGLREALAFLRDSAEFERQKELQFFKNFETSHPEIKSIFNISVENVLNDYEGFIMNLNRAIKGTEQLKKEIDIEIARIKKNRKAMDTYYDKKKLGKKMGKDEHDAYIKDLQRELAISKSKNNSTFYMKANGETTFQSLFKQNGHMHTLTQLIIEKFGHKLFDNNLRLNAREVSALIAAITMKANELFMSSIKLPTIRETVQKTAQETVDSIEMENFVNSLLKSNDLKGNMQSIMDQYDISYKKSKKINDIDLKIERIKQSLYANFKQLKIEEKKGITFDNWLESIGMTEEKIKKMIEASELISAQCYYVGEDLSMLDLISNRIQAVLGGNKNPTDDIQGGALIVDFDFNSNKLDELEQKLWEKQRSTFLNKVDKTTTYESYRNNIIALKQAREEQQEAINEFKIENEKNSSILNDLLQHINIHSTVKGYESAGSILFEQNGGFGGAAFGSTLQDELSIINDMIIAGGLDMQFDVENLYIAMINCGRLMMGNTLKPILVNYLSAFMGMFMFNDASLFAEDVKNWINNEKILIGNVQDLHLYQLNGIIVPSSYILQKTYEAMFKLESFNNNYKGVQAVFTTYDKNYIRGQWAKTSALAVENTKLERMHFLAGFFDLLENIQLKLSNIS